MAMLSDAEIEAMRAVCEEIMPDYCTIGRVSDEGQGEYGGWGDTFETVDTGVPCLVSPVASFDLALVGRQESINQFFVSLPVGTDCQEGDLISVDGWTRELLVVQVYDPESWDLYLHVEANVASGSGGNGGS